MRIISIFVSLPMIIAMQFPQAVLAGEAVDTNTKINFDLTNNLKYPEPVSINDVSIPYNYAGYVPMEDEENLKRDVKIAMRNKKRLVAKPRSQKITINASAYTAAADECGKSDGITASGLKVKEKRTLACPLQYPFGTKVKIDGMGTFTCEDRGGAIKGNKFDIYMETKAEAFGFGRKNINAEIL